MENLLDLRLDHNRIEFIVPDTFRDLIKLEWLSLTDNKLKSLNEDLTLAMPELLWFTANYNFIERFDESFFTQNPKLELISMRGNKIKEINFKIKNFNRLSFLDFRQNLCIDDYVGLKHPRVNELQDKIYKNCREQCQIK